MTTGSGEAPPRVSARDVAVVLLVGALSLVLAQQGWRSRTPGIEWIPSIDGAHAFLSAGSLPEHGTPTSLNSYASPGFAWLVLPGVALFSDPRLFVIPGTVLLHFGTLAGIFLLARTCFGTRCALWSVVLYGVSERGLWFAGSYEPRGLPFFYVWTAYWTCQWVVRQSPWYMAAALVTWATGSYVFLEAAPAVLMLPAVWVLYRPPVRWRPLVAAAAASFVLWAPYLRFERGRDFTDLRSQVLLQVLEGKNAADPRCDSRSTVKLWPGAPAEPEVDASRPFGTQRSGALPVIGRRVLGMARGLLINFEGPAPGAAVVLLMMTIAGMLMAGRVRWAAPRTSLTVAGIVLLAWAIVANEAVVGRLLGSPVQGSFAMSTIRNLQVLALIAGVVLLAGRYVSPFLASVGVSPTSARVMALTLLAPWAGWLFLAEWGREGDRLGGLWPLQAILLAFFVSALSAQAHVRPVRWIGPLLLIGFMAVNPLVVSRLDAWRHEGWSGADAPAIRITDALAARAGAEGRTRVSIGYSLFSDGPIEPPWKAVDARWRDGEYFDILLAYRHGISNLNQCPNGLSPDDEYRVVEAYPPDAVATYSMDAPLEAPLRLMTRVDSYEVYGRER